MDLHIDRLTRLLDNLRDLGGVVGGFLQFGVAVCGRDVFGVRVLVWHACCVFEERCGGSFGGFGLLLIQGLGCGLATEALEGVFAIDGKEGDVDVFRVDVGVQRSFSFLGVEGAFQFFVLNGRN